MRERSPDDWRSSPPARESLHSGPSFPSYIPWYPDLVLVMPQPRSRCVISVTADDSLDALAFSTTPQPHVGSHQRSSPRSECSSDAFVQLAQSPIAPELAPPTPPSSQSKVLRNLNDTAPEYGINHSDSDAHFDLNMDNTLSSTDLPFSQELSRDADMRSSSEDSFENDNESVISEEEVNYHHAGTAGKSKKRTIDAMDHNEIVMEDCNSLLFTDYMSEYMASVEYGGLHPNGEVNIQSNVNESISEPDLEGRGEPGPGGGLKEWAYASPFCSLVLEVDSVDRELFPLYVKESNIILDRVLTMAEKEEIANSASVLSRLTAFEIFLPLSILEKLRSNINSVLRSRNRNTCSVIELKGTIILHVLAASYGTCVSTITKKENLPFYFQVGISGERYKEIWSCLNCSKSYRSRVEQTENGWLNKPSRGNALITELEAEFAAVNRALVKIEGVTIYSVDDDHNRLSSRSVVHLTNLSQVNNPKKALGPVNNAACSALTHALLASHYTRSNEKIIDIWQRLVMLIQGVPTPGSIRPMVDSLFAADRGYNEVGTIRFLNETLAASCIGTHKRSLSFPFVFGDGAIRKRHKGMVISERGCRAVYSAVKKPAKRSGRAIQASVYRESFSGRIAAVYSNDERRFGAHKFCVIPKESYRNYFTSEQVEEVQVIFDRRNDTPSETGANYNLRVSASEYMLSTLKVVQVLSKVRQLTIYQAEDPGWFLARAFMFTSRTVGVFFSAISSNSIVHLHGLSSSLKGVRIQPHTAALPTRTEDVLLLLKDRWKTIISTVGITEREAPPDVTVSSVDRFMGTTRESLGHMRKDEILSLLAGMNKSERASKRKNELIERVLDIQLQVDNGETVLTPPTRESVSEDGREENAIDEVLRALYKASLSAWAMKPLIATAGMKEGTINEVEVLRAIPKFMKDHKVENTESLFSISSREPVFEKYRADYIRCVGLVASKTAPMLADSPDGLLGFYTSTGLYSCAAIEVKTMASPTTIDKAKNLRAEYGPFSKVNGIGLSDGAERHFKKLVFTPEYRLQCLHHAAVLGITQVVFVVAKGSRNGVGEIIYAVMLEFAESLRYHYMFVLDSIRASAFTWIGGDALGIPKRYEDLVENTFAADLYSLASFYNLSQAYKALVHRNGPLPPSRMIRPLLLVYWNTLKGGVDEFSRALKTLAYTNTSENPIVSIIGRLISSQVGNAAIAHRFFIARKRGVLPPLNHEWCKSQTYKKIRHQVTSCESFGTFARELAREYVQITQHDSVQDRVGSFQTSNVSQNEPSESNSQQKITPMYYTNVVEKYNRADDAARRLNNPDIHERVKAKATYCSLCSYNHSVTYRGRKFQKKGGAKVVQWCSICKQPICKKCWDAWHSKRKLQKSVIPAIELCRLNAKARNSAP